MGKNLDSRLVRSGAVVGKIPENPPVLGRHLSFTDSYKPLKQQDYLEKREYGGMHLVPMNR
jgi:hypothetical protein